MGIDATQHEHSIKYAVKLICDWSVACRPSADETISSPLAHAVNNLSSSLTRESGSDTKAQGWTPTFSIRELPITPAFASDASAASTSQPREDSSALPIHAGTHVNNRHSANTASNDRSTPTDLPDDWVDITTTDAGTQTEQEHSGIARVDAIHRRAQLLLAYEATSLQHRIAARELSEDEMRAGNRPTSASSLEGQDRLVRRKIAEAEELLAMAGKVRTERAKMTREEGLQAPGDDAWSTGADDQEDSDDGEDTSESDEAVGEGTGAGEGFGQRKWSWLYGCVVA